MYRTTIKFLYFFGSFPYNTAKVITFFNFVLSMALLGKIKTSDLWFFGTFRFGG